MKARLNNLAFLLITYPNKDSNFLREMTSPFNYEAFVIDGERIHLTSPFSVSNISTPD